VVGTMSGNSVMAQIDFKKGDLTGYLDGVWITSAAAKREIQKMNTVGLHQPFQEMFLDTSVFDAVDNPLTKAYDFFDKKSVNIKGILTDINRSMHGLIPRVLFVATKDITAGTELCYEKGKNYYCNLGTFQKLSSKKQEDCKSYYDITLDDLNPKVKSWKVVTSKPISVLAHPLNSVGAENPKAKKAKK
jgi:hypothetical protein